MYDSENYFYMILILIINHTGEISRTGDVNEKHIFEDDNDSPKESSIKIEQNNLQNQNDEKHDQ